jgi:hypothetical protein
MAQTSQSNYVNGTLHLLILEAENLKKKDFNKMDPYCVVDFQGKKYETKPCKKGHLNPKWDETLEIPIGGVSLNEPISFWVYDKEILMDNKIGKIELDLQRLADMCASGDVCNLELETFSLLNKGKPAGVLRIKSYFNGSGWPVSDISTASTATGALDHKYSPTEKQEIFIHHKVEQPIQPLKRQHEFIGSGALPVPQTQGGDSGLPTVDNDLTQRLQDIELQERGEPVDGWPGAYEKAVGGGGGVSEKVPEGEGGFGGVAGVPGKDFSSGGEVGIPEKDLRGGVQQGVVPENYDKSLCQGQQGNIVHQETDV